MNKYQAKELFHSVEIKFTAEGHRHVGVAIGTEQLRNDFVSGKVEKKIRDVRPNVIEFMFPVTRMRKFEAIR